MNISSPNCTTNTMSAGGWFITLSLLSCTGNIFSCVPVFDDESNNRMTFPPHNQIDCTTVIKLKDNQISTVGQNALVGLNSLIKFDMTSNLLQTFPNFIPVKDTIENIMLSGNFITTIPSDIGELRKLRLFRMQGNPVTALPSLSGLLHLDVVELSDSNLASSLITVPTQFDRIFLDGTMISNLRIQCASGADNCLLRFLKLSNNPQMTQLPNLDDVLRIQELHISGNGLPDDELFLGLSTMYNLTKLVADHNNLTKFPNLASSVNRIVEIDLKYNQITTINLPLLEHMVNLQTLDMSYNNVKTLDASVMLPLSNLLEFDLTGQTLDCTMHWVTANGLVHTDYTPETVHLMTCQGRS